MASAMSGRGPSPASSGAASLVLATQSWVAQSQYGRAGSYQPSFLLVFVLQSASVLHPEWQKFPTP